MATGEALAALIHHGLVSCAHQVSTGLPIREAAVEEVWAWPPHYQFDCVGEDAIQGQGQAGRQAGLPAVGCICHLETPGQEYWSQRGEEGDDLQGTELS